MRPRLWIIGLVAIAGCGGKDTSVCDRLATGLTDLTTKAAPCFSSVPQTPLTADQCRQSIDKCSDSDKQKLGDFGSCLSALPTCNPQTLSAWQSSVQSCLAGLQGLSSGC